MDTSSIPGLELIQVADVVAREKSIEREEVMLAMEEAIQKAGRAKYGLDRDIRAMIDRKTGAIRLERWIEVVEEVEDESMQMSLAEGAKQNPPLAAGEFWRQSLPPIEFGRIAAQTAKQVISQKVRDAERARQFEEYKHRIGEIVVGTVKRAESYSITVDLGRAEAVIRREEMIPRENLRQGDRVRAYIIDVREEPRGPQIFLSRACNEFMAKLFTQEVPEIYDGIIEIKGVAREPGSRAKIAVLSNDPGIDPVGACVGMRGSRVQAVVNELQGEKIDIIPWNEDVPTFLVNALQPAEVSKVVLDEEAERIEVVVPDEQLSLAIGRRGQNVRLASQLTGLEIEIMTEADESERRQREFELRTKLFMDKLDLDEFFAQLLVSEGFTTLEEVAYVEVDELLVIEGVDDDTANELQARARDILEADAKAAMENARSLGLEDSLAEFGDMSPQMLEALAKDDVKTLEDFATCADWELAGGWTSVEGERVKDDGILEPFGITLEEAQDLVMSARIQLGWIDPAELETADHDVEEEDAE